LETHEKDVDRQTVMASDYIAQKQLLAHINIIVLGKTGRGAGDQWVKPGNGNWEIDRISFQKCLIHLFNVNLHVICVHTFGPRV